MNIIDNLKSESYAILVLCSATAFTIFWFLDSVTHGKLVHSEITKKELHTHRIILLTSVLMELSLVLMYWYDILVLPLFAAFFITRTIHEFIDELHWHTERCSGYETALHLAMWLSILTNTFAMFIWGFFTHYKGLTELHFTFYIWAAMLSITITGIGLKEWKR